MRSSSIPPLKLTILTICQIEGHILDLPAGPQPPNPSAKCPIYRWNLQHKYNYTVTELNSQTEFNVYQLF